MANNGHDDWMKETKGGKRVSAYSKPKREPVRKTGRGNVADAIRDKNKRTEEQSY